MNLNKTSEWFVSPEFLIMEHPYCELNPQFSASFLYNFPGGLAGFSADGTELLFLTRGVIKLLEFSQEQLIPGKTFRFGANCSTDVIDSINHDVSSQLEKSGQFTLNYALECPDKGLTRVHMAAGLVDHQKYGTFLLCLFYDVTEKDCESYILTNNTLRDELTGLFLKQYFYEIAHEYLSNEGQNGTHAFFFISLDNFRKANTLLGRHAGDEILRMVGALLARTFREQDLLCRYGGDTFAVLMKDVPSLHIVEDRAKTICQMLRQLSLEFEFPPGSCSIGGLYGQLGNMTPDDLLEDADLSLYRAKAQGNGNWDISTVNSIAK